MEELKAEGVRVIGASSDPLEDAQRAINELGLEYPLAYDVDAEKVAETLGSFYEVYKEARPVEHTKEEEDEITGNHEETARKFVQPTGVLIRPDNTIDVICYSSGHLGRLTGKDVFKLVRFYHQKEESEQPETCA